MEWAQVHTQGMMAKKISKIGRLSLLVALRRMVMSFREILLPLFVLNILLLDEAFYGLMVAAAGYMQSGALFPAGWISDRRGRGFAILVGGVFGGSCLLLIPFAGSWFLTFILYAMTGIGAGFTMTSIDTLIADYSKRGDEMTKSYGYTRTIAVLTAVLGPLLAGFILDPSALPGINPIMLRYSIVFFIMGSLNIAAGVTGFFTERWLIANLPESEREENECVREDESERRQDVETALLFGVS
ncbi:MAG: MFS transporter, partial [Candidatus Thorarchaeota archaeon]|nr:MFS transporter [Candidatus Thorarchaeota archaeon]